MGSLQLFLCLWKYYGAYDCLTIIPLTLIPHKTLNIDVNRSGKNIYPRYGSKTSKIQSLTI